MGERLGGSQPDACEQRPNVVHRTPSTLRAACYSSCAPAVGPWGLQVSKASPSWKAYVDYVSGIVLSGFSSAILASARYLLAQMVNGELAKLPYT